MDVRTDRLVLHAITPDEAGRIVDGRPGPGDRWHPEYPFADELVPLRTLAAAMETDPVFTLYQVQERVSGLAVGGLGFFGPPDDAGAVELGYGLVAAARGRGYATEALVAAAGTAFAHGARLVRADTLLGNAASRAVLERAGFAEVRSDRDLAFFELHAPADPG